MITLYFFQYTSIIVEDPGVDGRIILRWIFRSWMWVIRLDRACSW